MFAVYTLLIFIIPIIALYFLIRKQKFNNLIKADWSRLKIAILFLFLWSFSFVQAVIKVPPSESLENNSNHQQIAQSTDQTKQEVTENTKQEIKNEGSNQANEAEQKPDNENQEEQLEEDLDRVARVIDGDTIELEDGRKVRYIGIDAPETKHPNKPIECYGQEASDKNKSLVEGKFVKLEKDVSETDQYNRLLRYVYVDGQMVNELLVKQGYARASSYPPDVKYQDRLRAAEQEARSKKKGLWGDVCASPTQKPAPTSQPTSKPVVQEPVNRQATEIDTSCKYDCSGPDRDCSDFATHSEAQAFFNCCGFSVNNDPMRLDSIGVGDGVPCESLP